MSLEYAYTPSRKVISQPEESNYNPVKKITSQENSNKNCDIGKTINIKIQSACRRALENPT